MEGRHPHDTAHLSCPFCASYDVDRLFLASLRTDSCECRACGSAWDEDRCSGEYLGRADRTSVFMPRHRVPIGTPEGR
jgi:hypothetical protein